MQIIGEDLKKHRNSMGFTVLQVSRKIKIRKKYLEAIEVCDVNNLPSNAYTVGYVKEYCKFLGLESKEYIKKLRSSKEGKLKGGASKNLITDKEFLPSFPLLISCIFATILIYLILMYVRN